MATDPPCCGGAGGRYEDFRASDGTLHSRWVRCATCFPEVPRARERMKTAAIAATAVALLVIVIMAFTMCAGTDDTPKSPSYLPQH